MIINLNRTGLKTLKNKTKAGYGAKNKLKEYIEECCPIKKRVPSL